METANSLYFEANMASALNSFEDNFNYSVISENCYSDDLGGYRSYGIRIAGDCGSDTLSDISTCGKTVDYMAELFYSLQVSYIHLKDVVSDMLP